ncbi:MAG: hypothetical protein H0W08_25800, partial [Acidobacteria bacterium]|nr:hypothetical protein [Acidobacteriota bacterium]
LAGFDFDPQQVDRIFDAVAQGATSLVIDMRGNPGGVVQALEQIAGRLFEREVKLADLKGRRSSKSITTKKRKNPFTRRVIALIDSESASAAEVLARVLQLEGRGTVIGDRPAGSVMQGVRTSGALEGAEGFVPFEFSVTNADLIMKDGKSLDRVGVTPDELLRPTAEELARGQGPGPLEGGSARGRATGSGGGRPVVPRAVEVTVTRALDEANTVGGYVGLADSIIGDLGCATARDNALP